MLDTMVVDRAVLEVLFEDSGVSLDFEQNKALKVCSESGQDGCFLLVLCADDTSKVEVTFLEEE